MIYQHISTQSKHIHVIAHTKNLTFVKIFKICFLLYEIILQIKTAFMRQLKEFQKSSLHYRKMQEIMQLSLVFYAANDLFIKIQLSMYWYIINEFRKSY